MRPEDSRDMARLWDMLDASRAAVQFVQGRLFEHLLADRMLRNAVERNLEIIGEAANHVSRGTRDLHPEIPWKSMIGLRNVLAHEYGEIRYEIIWKICKENLPRLIQTLEKLGVSSIPPEEDHL